MEYTKARQKHYKHHLYIADEKDVNQDALLNEKSERFNFVIGGKISLKAAYFKLSEFSELKRTNFALIEKNHHSLEGKLYFFPKLDVYSSNGLFKKGIIGTISDKSGVYSVISRHEF